MQLSAKLTNGLLVFQRYRLKRLLGRGGMGVVWLAHDTELEKDIALKFLSEHLLFDSAAVRDLKKETRRGMELSHPNIIRVYGFFSEGNMAAVAMEYVEGNNLSSLRDTRTGNFFEIGEIANWTLELCSALHYAHAHAEIVHRDLKPANLMVDHRSRLKVADFGISASISDTQTRLTGASTARGTMLYMSPQQMLGQRPCISHDIYSLGATLYDLLTGKPPFYTGDISLQVRDVVPPTIRARREELGQTGDDIPAAWEETIAACLNKDATARPRDAAEVITRLCLNTSDGLSESPLPFAPLTPGSSASAPTSYDRVPLTVVNPPSPAPSYDGPSSATVQEPAQTTLPATETGRSSPFFSSLTLVLLVLCSVVGGGGVAFFAFQHGSNQATVEANAQPIYTSEPPNSVPANVNSQPANNVNSATPLDGRLTSPGTDSSRQPRIGEPGYGPPRQLAPGQVPEDYGRAADGINSASRTLGPAQSMAKVGYDFDPPRSKLIFRWVPPGAFRIGAPRHHPELADVNANTAVTISEGYWVSNTEVTQGEFSKVMGFNPSEFQDSPRLPVTNVSWDEAMGFCERYGEIFADEIPEGYEFTLPTQVQYEYASVCGTPAYYKRNGGFSVFAWSADDRVDQPQFVASKQANDFLIYDMSGNVMEWCRDWYAPLPGGSEIDFAGPQFGTEKVVKGGSYLSENNQMAAHLRSSLPPDGRYKYVGFRVALVKKANKAPDL